MSILLPIKKEVSLSWKNTVFKA